MSKWIKVDRDRFHDLMKQNMATPFMRRQRVTYWGTAARKGLGKSGPKIGEFYVLDWVEEGKVLKDFYARQRAEDADQMCQQECGVICHGCGQCEI